MKTNTTDYINFPTNSVPKQGLKQQGNLAVIPIPQSEPCPFRRLIQDWLTACRANGLSPKTLKDYQDKAFKFWWWWNDGTRYADRIGKHPKNITVNHAREFVTYLREPQEFRWASSNTGASKYPEKLSPESVKSYGRTIKAFFNWLVDEGELDKTPFNKSVKFSLPGRDRTQIIKRLEPDELVKVFNAMLDPERLFTFIGKRNLAMLALLLDSGIRRGELMAIQEADIDLENLRVKVHGKTGQRYAMFREECKFTLHNYMMARDARNPHGYKALWLSNDSHPMTYEGFSGVIKAVKEWSGVNFHAHEIRHTFASLMAEQGIDPFALKEMMGHSNITTTQIYVQHSQAALAEAHRTRSPLGQLPLQTKLKRRPGRPAKSQ